MRSVRRGTAVMVLLSLLLAPGVAQAGTWSWSWSEISAETFFNKLWSLIAFWQDDSGSDATSKNGGTADPAGQPPPPSSSSTCDNGGTADPAGEPCNG